MKLFKDLKIGDKVFELFDDNTVGIYEISRITLLHKEFVFDGVDIYVNFILGKFKRSIIRFSYSSYMNRCWFRSDIYASIVFSDEKEFLKVLSERNENV